ncbi:hypothetical protein OXPF_09490 [Oxobacter pfennigii]|uniref:DUF523 domain-containing protein n=1 Tax=Oxobacter pfennigii TaxID=36849 RepID=A0A0P8WAR3_9CLOT|nr:CD3072 family TudS-related putative desulfidase [Oxobacter pfennigii]KPU45716.1 hypothetical protein OXPF_09490 [Oxobacter pfennigii]
MLRKKEVVLVSHCVLNQNSVVYPMARAEGTFKFINFLMERGIGIIQLPCPELRYLGVNRKPMYKEEYDTEEYRKLCVQLFIPILDDIIMYSENGYSVIGIIGINESPTCSISGKRGIFMEVIIGMLKKQAINLKFYEVPPDYNDDKDYKSVWLKINRQFEIG